ncbi:MAG: thioredoxin family protein [Planctomycetota bacterium]|jgi:small redox-active disulfide protein 2
MPEDDFRMVSVGRARVGMRGLGAIFEKLAADGRLPPASPDDDRARALGLEIVELAGVENYVPDSARDAYAAALLAEFRRHLGEDVPDAGGVPTLKVLGPGCPRCEKLTASVMAALEKLGLAADVEHVRDPARIGEFGVVGTLALVVDGKVVSSGRALSADEAAAAISKALSGG